MTKNESTSLHTDRARASFNMSHKLCYVPALLALLTISLLSHPAAAQRDSGGSRMDKGQCPDDTESHMVYSPFVPYFKFDFFKGNAQKCWVAAGTSNPNS